MPVGVEDLQCGAAQDARVRYLGEVNGNGIKDMFVVMTGSLSGNGTKPFMGPQPGPLIMCWVLWDSHWGVKVSIFGDHV